MKLHTYSIIKYIPVVCVLKHSRNDWLNLHILMETVLALLESWRVWISTLPL